MANVYINSDKAPNGNGYNMFEQLLTIKQLHKLLHCMVGLIQAINCRHINSATGEEIDERLRYKYSPMIKTSFSAIRSLGKAAGTEGISSFHAVSHRLVPGGPNPLHN
ncbi:hypothetical protein CCACVL1_09838 [Corchorus capsularis]|uniref:Uncharacterized protein n=1 Tax=Corchorus capsularis TaxID=210143 RepID=A0A1R3ITX4_COCAP|nr:hypothetical protein CCACVL1_09838 [Corchorus capsularis]